MAFFSHDLIISKDPFYSAHNGLKMSFPYVVCWDRGLQIKVHLYASEQSKVNAKKG